MTREPARRAAVIGSGPNGLAAAIVLARAGVDVTVFEAADTIGGGTRSAELTVPGLVHDICSAIHPLGVASPFMRSLDLERHGLQWAWPEVDAAHPLDGGRAALMYRDLDRTVRGLGSDGAAWRSTFRPLVDHADHLLDELLGPIVHVPRHPLQLATFGLQALRSAEGIAKRFSTDECRGLFAGLAAHAMRPLSSPTTGGLGLMFGLAGHSYGWPAAVGGSASIARAMAAELTELGGRIETGQNITELPDAHVVMFDTSPSAAADIAGERLQPRRRRSLRKWRIGPGVFKVDLAVRGGVPWDNEGCRVAGTVHMGGTFEEVAAAEQQVADGQMPERPFVLVAQQYVADPSRSVDDLHPVWTYAHVPHGYEGDATEAILDQIERFAPGLRDRIEATVTTSPAQWEAYNPNYLGGDIGGGANDPWQLLARPRLAPDPYKLGDGLYLCSASTPPGAGVHGMCGFRAAESAVNNL